MDFELNICVGCENFTGQNSSTWPMVKLRLYGIYLTGLLDGISFPWLRLNNKFTSFNFAPALFYLSNKLFMRWFFSGALFFRGFSLRAGYGGSWRLRQEYTGRAPSFTSRVPREGNLSVAWDERRSLFFKHLMNIKLSWLLDALLKLPEFFAQKIYFPEKTQNGCTL